MEEREIIIGIPGHWKSRSEFVREVASKSEGYIFAGSLLSNVERKVL